MLLLELSGRHINAAQMTYIVSRRREAPFSIFQSSSEQLAKVDLPSLPTRGSLEFPSVPFREAVQPDDVRGLIERLRYPGGGEGSEVASTVTSTSSLPPNFEPQDEHHHRRHHGED